ncbi:hypothetical protein [Hymenobacter sp. DG01]|uniref:hypothetical protein n=1 Tax=Hymenobacter sp. DG01 TaxID=2584940 RepID=UPI00111F5E4F|nr:hypothetical protein [Hymenobacter sp. DG01]
METQLIIQQFQQLPTAAQRVVAELIELLSTQQALVNTGTADEGAIVLPHTALGAPTAWPENEFMNPEFYGTWTGRTDIIESSDYVRQLRQKQWGRNPE